MKISERQDADRKMPPRLFQRIMCHVSFKRKLILVYIFAVILPVLLAGIFLTTRMYSMAIGRTVDKTLYYAENIEQRINEVTRLISNLSDQIYVNEDLPKIVARKYESSWSVVTAMKNFTVFDDYTNYYPEVKDIEFYISIKNLNGNYNYVRTTDDLENYPWYQHTVSQRGLICWDMVYDEESMNMVLALTRLLRASNGMEMGVLIIQPDEMYLSSFLNERDFQSMLVGKEGMILVASDTSKIGENLKSVGFELRGPQDSPNVYDAAMNGEDSVATVLPVKIDGMEEPLRIVSVFPTHYILEEANRALLAGFSAVAASLLAALFLIVFFSEMLSRRIRTICDEMHSIASGNLKEKITVDGTDEIGTLSHDLSRMVKSINRLLDKVYIADMQKNRMLARQEEIRFKMLASQMNPHFLFNALESIRMSAHASGNQELAANVKLLGKIMRENLDAGRDNIPLERELSLVENYLLFQKFRFPDRLTYRIDRGGVDTAHPVLPFLIQPVVENCVVHGMEPCAAPCTVGISLWEERGTLSVCVSDNGAGMDQEALEQLRKRIEKKDGDNTHIGLRNVHQRIRIYYGKEYGLSLERNPHGGISVTIRIPLI